MGLLDVFLALFVGFIAFMGLRSGLIHESVTLLGLVGGLVVAGQFNEQFGPLLMPWLHTKAMSNLGAFIILLIGTWAAMLALGAFVRGLLDGIHLGWLDNVAGMALGLVKGVFLAEVTVLVLLAMPSEGLRDAVNHSFIGSWLAALAPDLMNLIPPILRYWKPF